jgi:hypothetical protein
MRQIEILSDERLEGACFYCGEYADTQDHVPSKVLLDEPFPENLPKVPCCSSCNQDFSLDEEYVACLIECIVHGTTDTTQLSRDKVKKILERKPKLQQRISNARVQIGERVFFNIEQERLKKILLKLARGHAKFENSELQLDEPVYFSIRVVPEMTDEELDAFLMVHVPNEILPEIGSRAFQRLFQGFGDGDNSLWLTVQENMYSYLVSVSMDGLTVKMVIREYLAVEVAW